MSAGMKRKLNIDDFNPQTQRFFSIVVNSLQPNQQYVLLIENAPDAKIKSNSVITNDNGVALWQVFFPTAQANVQISIRDETGNNNNNILYNHTFKVRARITGTAPTDLVLYVTNGNLMRIHPQIEQIGSFLLGNDVAPFSSAPNHIEFTNYVHGHSSASFISSPSSTATHSSLSTNQSSLTNPNSSSSNSSSSLHGTLSPSFIGTHSSSSPSSSSPATYMSPSRSPVESTQIKVILLPPSKYQVKVTVSSFEQLQHCIQTTLQLSPLSYYLYYTHKNARFPIIDQPSLELYWRYRQDFRIEVNIVPHAHTCNTTMPILHSPPAGDKEEDQFDPAFPFDWAILYPSSHNSSSSQNPLSPSSSSYNNNTTNNYQSRNIPSDFLLRLQIVISFLFSLNYPPESSSIEVDPKKEAEVSESEGERQWQQFHNLPQDFLVGLRDYMSHLLDSQFQIRISDHSDRETDESSNITPIQQDSIKQLEPEQENSQKVAETVINIASPQASIESPLLPDRYCISIQEINKGNEIHRGRWYTVFKGTWNKPNRDVKSVAIKEVICPDTNLLKSVCDEIKMMYALRSPFICKVYGACMVEKKVWIILKYADGGALNTFLSSSSPLPLSLQLSFCLQAAEALQFVHYKGVLHTNLTPHHFVICNKTKIVMTDFMFSTYKSTSHCSLLGSYAWTPPEIIQGQKWSETSEIYSLGMVMFAIVSRQEPFEHLNQFEITAKLNNNIRPSIPQKCPKELASLIQSCWSEDPSKRPTSTEVVEKCRNINEMERLRVSLHKSVIHEESLVPKMNPETLAKRSGLWSINGDEILNITRYLNLNDINSLGQTNISFKNTIDKAPIWKQLCAKKLNLDYSSIRNSVIKESYRYITELPTKLDSMRVNHDLYISGLTVRTVDKYAEDQAAFANAPFDTRLEKATIVFTVAEGGRNYKKIICSNVLYFEIHIAPPAPRNLSGSYRYSNNNKDYDSDSDSEEEEDCIAIGLAHAGFPTVGSQPGWEDNSYGYHSDDGLVCYSGRDFKYGPSYGTGDTVGCGLSLSTKEIFFTLNGKYLGPACTARRMPLYPVIGIDAENPITANFGNSPFKFDIESFLGTHLAQL